MILILEYCYENIKLESLYVILLQIKQNYAHTYCICTFKICTCYISLSPPVSPHIYLHGLWDPEVKCGIHKGSPIIPVLRRMIPIPRINTYFFKIHSNIVLPSGLGLPQGLFPVGAN